MIGFGEGTDNVAVVVVVQPYRKNYVRRENCSKRLSKFRGIFKNEKVVWENNSLSLKTELASLVLRIFLTLKYLLKDIPVCLG